MSMRQDTDEQTITAKEKTNMVSLSSVVFAATAVISFLIWPEPWSLLQGLIYVAWTAIVFILLVLAEVNARNGLLPDSILFKFLLPASITYTALRSFVSIDSLWQSLLGFVVLLIIPYIVFIASKGRYIGFGVVKTLAIVGLISGLINGLIILVVIVVGAGAYSRIVKRHELLVGWPIAVTTIIVQLVTMAMQIQ